MDIGSKIKLYRTAAALSQETLAERILVSRQTLSNWENSKTTPDIHSLLLLCDVFQITLDELIHGSPSPIEPIPPAHARSFRLTLQWMQGSFLAFWGFLPLLACIPQSVSVPVWLGLYLIASSLLLRVERLRKRYNIQTRRETDAFLQGKRLLGLESAIELGKRPYQRFLRCFVGILLLVIFTSLIMPPIFLLFGK